MPKKANRSQFYAWIEEVHKNPDLLKKVPLSFSSKNKSGKTIDSIWLEEKFSIPRKAFATDLVNEVNGLIELMIHNEILHPDNQRFLDWISEVLNDENNLWEIPIANASIGEFGFSINKSWLTTKTGIQRKAFTRHFYTKELDRVLNRMIEAEIILVGETAESNDIRRRLLGWFRKLNHQQKVDLHIHKGKICIKSLNRMKIFGSLSKNINEKSVKNAILFISNQLRKIKRKQTSSELIDLDNSVLKKNSPKKRLDVNEFTLAIKKWLKRLRNYKSNIYAIEIKSKRTGKDITYQVSKKWFLRAFKASDAVFYGNYDLINQAVEMMIQRGVIEIGTSVFVINKRKKILDWFNSLTIEEKLKIPIYSNRISRAYLETKVGSLSNISFFKKELQIIANELLELGLTVHETSFLTESQKRKLSDKSFLSKKLEKSNDWIRLSNILLNDVTNLTQPTAVNPFVQLQHLFAATIHGVEKNSTRKNAINSFYEYVRYIQINNKNLPVHLNKHFTEFTLIKFRSYLEKKVLEGVISESYANSQISGLRKAILLAQEIKGLELPSIVIEEGFAVIDRKTNAYRPFSDEERIIIDVGLKRDLESLSKFLDGYVPIEGGISPLDENLNFKRGCRTVDGCRWIFDNLLESKVVDAKRSLTRSKHKSLEAKFVLAMTSLGGLHKIYNQWGVPTNINVDFLLPYFVRLMQITGMNMQSVCDLELDSFLNDHPISGGRACIRYWKERSTGDKLYFLDIFNSNLKWLTSKQAVEVKKCFDEVTYITGYIREKAPKEIKNRLFIYESNDSVKKFEMLRLFNPVKRMGIRFGIKEGFNLARLRPTFVSDLIEMGVSIREIQLILGHASVITTMKYLDGLDFGKKAKDKLKSTLENIHNSVFSSDMPEKSISNTLNEIPVFKTPLASCKNIFDPPEIVKRLKSYVPGTPCANYNKCLSCENVIIIKDHLPVLFAMQREYLEMSLFNRISETPYAKVIHENLILLDEILNYDKSDFDKLTLDEAKSKSMFIESTVVIDGVAS